MRAVAVAAVVAFHLGRLPGGFLGVDVFFVISGFLITRLLLAERDSRGRVSLRAFWGRRIRRLVPALLVVLPAVLLASRAWLPAWRLPGIRDDALAALAYAANWRFVLSGQSYFASGVDPSPLRHTWSLAIEEQFYLVWPLLVVAAMRLAPQARRAGVAVLALAVAVASATWMAWASTGGVDLTRIYYGTDTRVFALATGALVATGWDRFRAGLDRRPGPFTARGVAAVGSVALGLVAVLCVVAREDDAAFYRGGFQLAAVLSALAVAGLGLGVGPVASALSARPALWVGRRSYGIYLWSWPVQIVGAAALPDQRGWTFDVAVVAAAVGLAALSYRYVERPVIERRPLLPARSPRPRPERSGRVGWTPAPARVVRAVAALAVAAAVVVAASAGAPPEPDFLSVSSADVRDDALSTEGFGGERVDTVGTPSTTATTTAPPKEAEPPPLDPGPAPPFPPGAPLVATVGDAAPEAVHGRPLRVLAIGDSVAWSVAFEVEHRLVSPVQLSNRAILGCGVMPVDALWVSADIGPNPYADDCVDLAEAEELGMASGPDVVLFWFGAWEVADQVVDGTRLRVGTDAYAELLDARIQARIDRARAGGFPTVMVEVPCFGDTVPERFRTERRDPDRLAWVNERIRAVARRNPGWVRLIDPTPVVCDAEGRGRATTDTGIEVRPDGSHFSRASAAWLWDTWLARAVASALSPPP